MTQRVIVNYARARDGGLYLAQCHNQHRDGHHLGLDANQDDGEGDRHEGAAKQRYWRMAKGGRG